ncbi:ABC-2 transporter permease [Streptococcus sp. BJSWXB6CM1]|uniref:ABC-2 transporter permease n=1 Tax=Streptococcus fermentans TaxID=3095082 RepID=A0ABU5FVD5_9STRE|nr:MULTISPECIES: ABC-2 transporter permease [unclassified Streptococcus]MDY4345713.1 ABC-2 transporter permease [Streptococcus sp. BJSWXB5TM5]MDY4360805.1 ABC-2 transporter permease [Streptococcus sp. BJSWXB3CM3]MDY4370938.1 ABC-2 transporter permease [Streptococcus sp. BJSWXB6CM1]
MTALILKDIATLKKTLLLSITLCIALVVYGVYENEIFMIPLICTMIPLILTAIAFGYDTKSKFEQFAFSMPIKKSSFVLSKLFFAFVFGLFGSVCLFVQLVIKSEMSIDNIIFISLITLVASVLISSIQLPFILKYGAEKGRLIMVLTYFIVFSLSSLLKAKSDLLTNVVEFFLNNSRVIIFLGIVFVSIVIIGMAIKISILIMEKKEY